MGGRKWTKDELDYFIREYPKTDIQKLSDKLQRTPLALYSMAVNVGIVRDKEATKRPHKRPLTGNEEKWFLRNFPNMSNKTIAAYLGIKVNKVKKIAIRYGLHKSERYKKECRDYSYKRKLRLIYEWRKNNQEKVKEYHKRYIEKKNKKDYEKEV